METTIVCENQHALKLQFLAL